MAFVSLLLLLGSHSCLPPTQSFALVAPTTARRARAPASCHALLPPAPASHRPRATFSTGLRAEERESENDGSSSPLLGDAESALLGAAGLVAAGIMGYSEAVLFRTGCGLPAGPLGLVGAAEGVSYLGVAGLVGFSAYTKIRTGNGLPSGPGGVLGAAEGLSYLALVAGLVVLVSQVTNYGYIPNAVPMDGGMCS